MTGLFNLTWNEELPLTRIESIRTRHHGSGTGAAHRIKLTDEDNWYDLGRHAYHELITRPIQLLPANPPAELACWNSDGELEIWFEPVIAWALCFDGEVRPVTAGGVCNGTYSDSSDEYVRYPDGQIKAIGRHAYITGFQDVEALRVQLLDERRIAAEHRAAAAAAKPAEGGEA